MKQVIFLDVDGVFNSYKDRFSYILETDYHLKLLKGLVELTGAKLVLSSSWRLGERIDDTLATRLNEFNMETIGSTPYLIDGCRGDEIREWMNTCKEEIESFVILDDESDMAEFTKTNLVKTNAEVGLQEEDILKCIDILKD